jgi:uncharacterized protein YdbL (DUF1318 family)
MYSLFVLSLILLSLIASVKSFQHARTFKIASLKQANLNNVALSAANKGKEEEAKPEYWQGDWVCK